MVYSLQCSDFSTRFPEITNIECDEGANQYKITIKRHGYTSDDVTNTFVDVLIGERGEHLEYALPSDSRWMYNIINNKFETDTSEQTDTSLLTIDISFDVLKKKFNEKFPNYVYEPEEKDKNILYYVLKTQRAIHFSVFEKLNKSRVDLTRLYIDIGKDEKNFEKIQAISLYKQVIDDKYYDAGSIVWEHDMSSLIPSSSSFVFTGVGVDLGQCDYKRKEERTVWAATSSGHIICFDYFSGRVIFKVQASSQKILNLAVDSYSHSACVAVPSSSGNGIIVKLIQKHDNSAVGYYISSLSVDLSKSNLLKKMIPEGSTPFLLADKMTGGTVSRVPIKVAKSLTAQNTTTEITYWYTFIVNSEYTVAYKILKDNTNKASLDINSLKFFDRVHFGSFHAKPKDDIKMSVPKKCTPSDEIIYSKNVEYGIYNVPNIIGITNGILGDVFTNGHPYYHYDGIYQEYLERMMIRPNMSWCGAYVGAPDCKFPIYILDSSGKITEKTTYNPKDESDRWVFPQEEYWSSGDDINSQELRNMIAVLKGKKPWFPLGRNCRFGRISLDTKGLGMGGSFSEWTQHPNEHTYVDIYTNFHMETKTNIYSEKHGITWYQLQDVGLIYFANPAMNPNNYGKDNLNLDNEKSCLSTGVCEDNPLQNTFTINSDGTLTIDFSFPSNNFKYQQDKSQVYFNDMNDVSKRKGESFGWRGSYNKPSDIPGGFSEDWGVKKPYDGESSLYKNTKPNNPKITHFGLEETLDIHGNLNTDLYDGNKGKRIFQTDSNDYVHTIIFESTENATNTLSPRMTTYKDPNNAFDITYNNGANNCFDVCMDGGNNLFFSKEDFGKTKFEFNKTGKEVKLEHSYNEMLKQFTTLCDYTCSYPIVQACAIKERKKNKILLSHAKEVVIGNEITVSNNIKDLSFFNHEECKTEKKTGATIYIKKIGTLKTKAYNCDNTGMQGIKELGYCYTAQTKAHPMPVDPKGNIYITYETVEKDECGPDDKFWNHTYRNVSNIVGKGIDNNDENACLKEIFNKQKDEEAKLQIYKTNRTPIDVVSTQLAPDNEHLFIGKKVAGYEGIKTTHLGEIYDQGSYIINNLIFKYEDNIPGSITENTRYTTEYKYDVTNGIYSSNSINKNFYYCMSNEESHWTGITVHGKPLEPDIVKTNGNIIQKGVIVPSGNIYEENKREECLTKCSDSEDETIHASECHSKAYIGSFDKNYFLENNKVTLLFEREKYPYLYPNDSDEERFINFGSNEVIVYERWPSPKINVIKDEDNSENPISLWGDC